ncbi:MAG: 50S ribosomal protein L15 [Thermodesulfobacteriota bacterium]
MVLDRLKPPEGSRKKKKRVGRGVGSGHGKTACRGHKGQNARSGRGTKAGFEGGQMPLQRRLPKRGFKNPFKEEVAILHIRDLNRFPKGSIVEPHDLYESGLCKKGAIIKLLSDGELQHPLTIHIHKVSEGARKKIEAASGSIKVIQP